jgi:hypothetical protein
MYSGEQENNRVIERVSDQSTLWKYKEIPLYNSYLLITKRKEGEGGGE